MQDSGPWDPWQALVYQQGLQGAGFRTLGPVASPGVPAGAVGRRIQDPGTRDRHWCTSRGCRVQDSGPWDPWQALVYQQGL